MDPTGTANAARTVAKNKHDARGLALLLVTLAMLEIAIVVNQRLGQLADDMRANARGLRDAMATQNPAGPSHSPTPYP